MGERERKGKKREKEADGKTKPVDVLTRIMGKHNGLSK